MIFDNVESVYKHALINEVQIDFYRRHEQITSQKLLEYAPRWLWDDPQEKNKISYISKVMLEVEKDNKPKEVEKFLKDMFAKHMDYIWTENDDGRSYGPKSNQFHDSLFELEVMDFLIFKGYRIDLGTKKLENGKQAEYLAYNSTNNFFIEAKNFDFNGICDEVYTDMNNERISQTSYLSEYRQYRIFKRFVNQYTRAIEKFEGIKVKYAIFININLPLGSLGEKVRDYINSIFNSRLDSNLLCIGIFAWDRIHYYDNVLKTYMCINRNFNP